MKLTKLIFLIISIISLSCNNHKQDNKVIIVTSFPVYALLNEIVKDVSHVEYLVPTGASPHTYQPRPSDVSKCKNAIALFYVASNLDGWVSDFASDKKICLMDMVPVDNLIYFSCGHDHSDDTEEFHSHEHEIDPHFWLDPLTVKSMLGKLTDTLCKIFPESKDKIQKNSYIFDLKLDSIHNELSKILNNVKNKPAFLHHPSFNYLLNRYEIVYGGSIEESPGKEPSPKFISELVQNIKDSGVNAIFSEPQLNTKIANVIAKESGVRLLELNPEGGLSALTTYKDILINNAKTLKIGLE